MPRRAGAAPLLTPPLLIIVLPIIALLLIFFIIPPFLSISSQIHKSHVTVKKGWDSLNILLVVFAILCGVFAKRNDDDLPTTTAAAATEMRSNENENVFHKQNQSINSSHHQWFSHDDYFSDRKIYDRSPATGLKRSSSSYPDLREESGWVTGGDRYRFYDDFELNKNRSMMTSPDRVPLRRWRSQIDESDIKVIPVDNYVIRSSPPPPPPPMSPAPPPPPPPPPPRQKGTRRTYESVGRREKPKKINNTKIAPPPPPPPPPPVKAAQPKDEKKSERKKSNATREIKMVLASLYNQRKRKKKLQKFISTSYDEQYPDFRSPRQQTMFPPPSPPPPPPPLPPPPSSVFQNFFKKGSNRVKKIHSISPPPPPPPPPPSSRRKKRVSPPPPETPRRAATGKPPLPTRTTTSINRDYDENVNSGGQSPYIPMPPPPPPPPFKMPALKFVVKGDFAKIKSERSSRCSSPEPDEEIDLMLSKGSMEKKGDSGGGASPSTVFCPSPDVNMKADSFIARLRGEWRLEKINSMKEKGT